LIQATHTEAHHHYTSHVTQQNVNLNAPTLKLTIIVDTWASGHYGDPHAEVHAPHSAA